MTGIPPFCRKRTPRPASAQPATVGGQTACQLQWLRGHSGTLTRRESRAVGLDLSLSDEMLGRSLTRFGSRGVLPAIALCVLLCGAGSAAAASGVRVCGSAVRNEALPFWARGGFHPPTQRIPHVLGRSGAIVAILWAQSAGGPAAGRPQEQDPLGAPPFVHRAHESPDLRAADERNATGWQAGSKDRKGRSRSLHHQSAHRRLLAARAPLGWSQRQSRSPIQTEALARPSARGHSGTLAELAVLSPGWRSRPRYAHGCVRPYPGIVSGETDDRASASQPCFLHNPGLRREYLRLPYLQVPPRRPAANSGLLVRRHADAHALCRTRRSSALGLALGVHSGTPPGERLPP